MRKVVRFSQLTCAIFSGLVLLACLEGMFLSWSGVRYTAPSSVRDVAITQHMLSSDGAWGLYCTHYTYHGGDTPTIYEVFLHDFERKIVHSLNLKTTSPRAVAISPTQQTIVMVNSEGMVYHWDNYRQNLNASSAPETAFQQFDQVPGKDVREIFFSLDGNYLVAYCTQWIYVWDWPGRTRIHTFSFPGSGIPFAAVSRDSRQLISPGKRGGILIRDLVGGNTIRIVEPVGFSQIALLPEIVGERLIVLESHAVRATCVDTGEEYWRQPARTWFPVMNCSPDGKLVAVVQFRNPNYWIDVFETRTGNLVTQFPGHRSSISGMLFTHDSHLKSWDVHGEIHTWDLKKNELKSSFSLLEWARKQKNF